jgi:chromosome segregation protein
MIQFSRLRLNGFKSFVDRTELEIGPGLNGIVGPNGCGKSNLVEALRWVMGENSAKRMRGGGMEDVIFNGTSQRSKRNIAEVSLLLDNSTRSAPAAYNGNDEIEVIRKIERDRGSQYRINGKVLRARDIQMLFADTVTGSNSPALVSQGRVTQMINAKPHERRLILEDSAGISGLFARRHEAELRLKAADTNLLRIEDILGSMEGRLNSLKRQARQATRYRNVSTQIRQMEILIAYMEWQALEERMAATREKFDVAESAVAEHLATVTQLTKTQTTQAQDLPALRKAEVEAAASLQSQKVALQRIEDEASRLEQVTNETKGQLTQTETDFEHESTSLEDNSEALERMEAEHSQILLDEERADKQLAEKEALREKLEAKVLVLEEQYNTLMQGAAEAKAQQDSLITRLESNQERLERLESRKASAESDLKALNENAPAADKPLEKEVEALNKNLESLTKTIESNQSALEALSGKIEDARSAANDLDRRKSEFIKEISVLEGFLKSNSEDEFTPILGDVKAESGFEKALSRALGDSLLASLDEQASSSWRDLKREAKDLPALPDGADSLLPKVKAPKTLAPALSQIGVVKSEADGESLWAQLGPGQSLVSVEGTYWRWDGFTIKAEATDRHAQHLEQKNTLEALIKKRPSVEQDAQKAQEALEALIAKREAIEAEQKEARAERGESERALNEKRSALSALREKTAALASEQRRLEETISLAADDIAEVVKSIKDDKTRLSAYEVEKDDSKEQELEAVKTNLQEARQEFGEAVRSYDITQQQQNTRKARLQAIADERVNLKNRVIRARERMKELEERKVSLAEKLEELKSRPKDFEGDRAKLLDAISTLEKTREDAAEKLAACETEVFETGQALKEAENALGEVREARAHAQATLSAIAEQRDGLNLSIIEKFEMKPEALKDHSAIDMDKELGDLEGLKGKKERLIREREQIGAVNLRAEEEAAELEGEVGGLLHERNDLVQAIGELREGIQKINKEARDRLVAAFEHVNAHFQRLFLRLFGGGQAHLALIDSDDPLESGLEIFAQPPGKSLQSLSLLSGGEQTMASIALIFAMFLTNPSPICVLDEIDAPLDDANVDRVCDLLEEIAERGETRFLVITHHRLTMARMDRLYGVTMAEKGVSQLVSVDLQQSFDFLEEAA